MVLLKWSGFYIFIAPYPKTFISSFSLSRWVYLLAGSGKALQNWIIFICHHWIFNIYQRQLLTSSESSETSYCTAARVKGVLLTWLLIFAHIPNGIPIQKIEPWRKTLQSKEILHTWSQNHKMMLLPEWQSFVLKWQFFIMQTKVYRCYEVATFSTVIREREHWTLPLKSENTFAGCNGCRVNPSILLEIIPIMGSTSSRS